MMIGWDWGGGEGIVGSNHPGSPRQGAKGRAQVEVARPYGHPPTSSLPRHHSTPRSPGWFPAELFSQLNLLVCIGISREIRKDLAGAQQRSRWCSVSHRCCTFTVAVLLQRCCSSVALLLHRRCIIVALLCNTISESRTCQLLCMAHQTLHSHLSSSVQKLSCLAHIYKKIFGCA